MLNRATLPPQEALVCTMVLIAATSGITDREIGVMSGLVQTLPIFEDFSSAELQRASDAAVSLLSESDGLAHATKLIREALEPRLRETAYALACEVVAANGLADQEALKLLALVRDELNLDALVAAAIERATRARYQRLTRG
jgi:hypothetical protein